MERTIIDEMMEKARRAQAVFEGYSQQQVDEVVKTVGKTVFDNAELFAREAVEETGYGRVDSKVVKQTRACAGAWHYLHDKKSVGIIEYDEEKKLATYAKPLGVVCCITPATNPTSTVGSNGMNVLKSRNAMIVAPHPRAKKVSVHCVNLVNEALAKIGAPENLIQIIEEPSMDLTRELMSKVDVVVATGGAGMIKSAYSSGKPSFGVGQGNVQVLVADDYNDYDKLATLLVNGRSYDNGMPCTGEQALHYPKSAEKEILDAFAKAGGYKIPDDKVDALAAFLFNEKGAIDAGHVGMPAKEIAREIGVEVPDNTLVLLFANKGVGPGHILCREKLCPVTQLFPYEDFEQAVEAARTNLLWEGAGHTAVVFTYDDKKAAHCAERLPVGRLVVNQNGGSASGGNFTNGLAPTMSLGCGSWGNNSISDNLTYRNLMNTTKLAYPLENGGLPPFDVIWSE